MVASTDRPLRMTEAEYLEFEFNSELKHQYINGEVLVMASSIWQHNQISGATMANLYNQLRGQDYTVIPSQQRIKVMATGLITYPDVGVVQGKPAIVDKYDTIANPLVIIEILSASTEAYDRGVKFQHYRQIETLQDYLLIAQDKPHIEGFTRQDDGKWTLTEAVGLDSTFVIASIGCTLALADVYQNVTFPDTNTTNDNRTGAP